MKKTAWALPLLYYAAAMLYIYTTYALSQAQRPPLFFGDNALRQSLVMWLYTNSMVALGFLLFALSFERLKRSALLQNGLVVLGAVCIMGTAGESEASLPLLALIMLSVGYFAGGAHYVAAMTIDASWRGRFLGGAVSLTVFVQYFFFSDSKGVSAGLLLAVLAINAVLARECFHKLAANPPSGSGERDDEGRMPPSPRFIAMLALMVALMAILHGCGDCLAIEFYARFDESIFHDSIRLFLPVGMITAGCVADFSQRRYLLSMTTFALLLRVVSLIVTDTQDGFLISQSAEYFIDSFCIMCYTLYFLDVAAESSHPALWASMGRTLALPISAVSANVFGLIWAHFSMTGFVIAYVVILALLNIFFYHEAFREWLEIPAYKGDRAVLPVPADDTPTTEVIPAAAPEPPPSPQVSPEKVALSEKEKIAIAKKRYELTKREEEILQKLLGEDTAASIAEKLGIKERTVRYHISNLLRKTGTTHRAELRLLVSSLDE